MSSWLLDLTAAAFAADPQLDGFEGVVSDSGEGRWTAHAAIDEGVPAPVLSAALYARFDSRGRSETANKICRPSFPVRGPRGRNGTRQMSVRTQPPADALVLFGATGDLAKRKLFPYHLEMAPSRSR